MGSEDGPGFGKDRNDEYQIEGIFFRWISTIVATLLWLAGAYAIRIVWIEPMCEFACGFFVVMLVAVLTFFIAILIKGIWRKR